MLKVVQVNCVLDRDRRDPGALLEAWPTLPAVATATARAGAKVTVLQLSRTAHEHCEAGVTYRFVPRLREALRRERPDVVHFNGLDFPFRTRAVCGVGVPVMVQDHASRAEARFPPLRRWGLRKVAAAAFTSRYQAEPFLRTGQLPSSTRIFAIPESSSHFTPGNREQARQETGVHGDPALLWVGRLNSNKDPLTVLRAVRTTLTTLPGLQLWCAFAEGDLLPDIAHVLRQDEALAARVHLLGKVSHDKIEQLCRACDLFVSASRREGSGYALIETLACGLPPVVSDIPAFRALADGTGSLVPVGDSDAFAAAIVEQARRPKAELRAAVSAHFREHLSFDVVGRRLVDAYSQLAAACAGR